MNFTKLYFFNKNTLTLLLFFITAITFSQNKFREGSDLIINGSSLQESFYKCVESLGKPILSQTDDKLITAYSFKTLDGNIILGKDSLTKKFEGAIIFIKSETESEWITNYIRLNSRLVNGSLYLNKSDLKCVEYVGGNNKIIVIAFGDTDFALKMPMSID
jgi:hypothetical protein